MDLYLVYVAYDYIYNEGESFLVGVYSTLDLAKQCVEESKAQYNDAEQFSVVKVQLDSHNPGTVVFNEFFEEKQ
jgi:hypothetical protein